MGTHTALLSLLYPMVWGVCMSVMLPKWFSLERYDVAATFSPYLWHKNLTLRALYLNNHTTTNADIEQSLKALVRRLHLSTGESEEDIYKNLTSDKRKSELDKGRFSNDPPKLITEAASSEKDVRSVWGMSRLDAYLSIVSDGYHKEIISWLHPEGEHPANMAMFRKYEINLPTDYREVSFPIETINTKEKFEISKKKLVEIIGIDEFTKGERWRLTESMESAFSGDIESVGVWLEMPDKVIVDSFKKWLAEKRIEKPLKKPNKTVSVLEKWHNYKILAYLDLLIWAETEGVDLPYHKIGEALFPDDVDIDTTERIRKVVKPLAIDAIRTETTTWLTSIRVE